MHFSRMWSSYNNHLHQLDLAQKIDNALCG